MLTYPQLYKAHIIMLIQAQNSLEIMVEDPTCYHATKASYFLRIYADIFGLYPELLSTQSYLLTISHLLNLQSHTTYEFHDNFHSLYVMLLQFIHLLQKPDGESFKTYLFVFENELKRFEEFLKNGEGV